jgi:carbon-monoxide dehydrogenase medium subunit
MLASTPGARVIAGGQSLIPLLRYRLIRPPLVVDIGRISDMRSIEVRDGWVEFGALVTSAELAGDRLEVPAIAREAAAVIADPQVRNLGTIGGNLAHADPQNDLPAVLVAGRGYVHATGARGSRVISADDFFVGPFMTSLDPTEIVTRVDLPIGAGAYEKFKASAGDYGIGGVAVQLRLDPTGLIQQAGISVTGIFGLAVRANAAEELLVGTRGESGAVAGAGLAMDDQRGSARYKSALAITLTHRALSRATGALREESK